jgi:hypothetical protein
MMWIISSKGSSGDRKWHVGDPSPEGYISVSDVAEVGADGHELEYITAKFVNLPVRSGKRLVTWYGDMAKFIVGNL